MQIHILKKGLALGIIVLLFSLCVLPSACGKLVTPTINDSTGNHSTYKYSFIVVGLLTDKINSGKNVFNYVIVLGFWIGLMNGKYGTSSFVIDSPFGFSYGSKIGILTDHFVCAIFFNIS